MQTHVETARKLGIPKGFVEPKVDDIDPEAAWFILGLTFSDETQKEIHALLEANRERTLTPSRR